MVGKISSRLFAGILLTVLVISPTTAGVPRLIVCEDFGGIG